MKKISFVIPCYRSEKTIESVVDEIHQTMTSLSQYEAEIILINDNPPDGTWDKICELSGRYPDIKGACMSRNFGQHSALMAGFSMVSGDYVICLDDDGQTPAVSAGDFIQKLEEGFDVVYARYHNKKHSAFRNFGSRINEMMTRVMLGKSKELYISSYFAARRYIIDEIVRYKSAYPYVIGLILRTTKKIANVDVSHRERLEGISGYTMKALLGLWFNGFTAFSIIPLRFATVTGCLCAVVGFLYGIYTVIKRLIIPDIPIGFSALMSVMVFIGGMIMIMLGLIGEYVGRIYLSLNNAPQYVIKETISHNASED